MPQPFTYEPFQKDASFEGALLVVAFPAAGFVSQVAARHLIANQELPLVGAFCSAELPPAVAIENGRALPPIRTYVGKQVCGLDQDCDALATVIGDIIPPEHLRTALATSILDWAEKSGVECVLALESIPLETTTADHARISCATNSDDARARLEKEGVAPLDGVLVSGMTAALLEASRGRDIEVIGLFVEAHSAFRDAGAAAQLVELIDKLLLHIPIDSAPLRAQAESLTTQLKTTAQRTQTAFPSLSMYG